MKYLKQVRDFLSGKKTYIVGAITVLLGAYLQKPELMTLGFLALTGRAGIAKIEKRLE